MFLLVLRLQVSLDYSALAAGASLVPFTVIMLLLSPFAGQLGQKIGARIPLTVGPLVAAVGLFLLSGVDAGDSYLRDVLPGVVVLGVGMAITVAPLTAAVLGSVGDDMAGVASGVNNAVARFAGMLAVAALPALAGIATGRIARRQHRLRIPDGRPDHGRVHRDRRRDRRLPGRPHRRGAPHRAPRRRPRVQRPRARRPRTAGV